jgi:hypothetical protein
MLLYIYIYKHSFIYILHNIIVYIFCSFRPSLRPSVCSRLTFYWKERRSCNMAQKFRLLPEEALRRRGVFYKKKKTAIYLHLKARVCHVLLVKDGRVVGFQLFQIYLKTNEWRQRINDTLCFRSKLIVKTCIFGLWVVSWDFREWVFVGASFCGGESSGVSFREWVFRGEIS